MPEDLPEINENQEVLEESQDLYEHFSLVVDKGQGLLRIDKFLMFRIENATRNKIQQAAHAGNIQSQKRAFCVFDSHVAAVHGSLKRLVLNAPDMGRRVTGPIWPVAR